MTLRQGSPGVQTVSVLFLGFYEVERNDCPILEFSCLFLARLLDFALQSYTKKTSQAVGSISQIRESGLKEVRA